VKAQATPEGLISYLSTDLQKLVIEDLKLKGEEVVAPKRYIGIDEKIQLAGNPNTPPETLAELAKDEKFRWEVAENPNTSPEILAELAKTKEDHIRYRIAENPNTSPETLAELAKDENRDVRYRAKENPNTPPEIKKQLKQTVSLNMRKKATLVVTYPDYDSNMLNPEELVRFYEQEKEKLLEESFADEVLSKLLYGLEQYMQVIEDQLEQRDGIVEKEDLEEIKNYINLISNGLASSDLNQKIIAVDQVINRFHGDLMVSIMNGDKEELSQLLDELAGIRKSIIPYTPEEEQSAHNLNMKKKAISDMEVPENWIVKDKTDKKLRRTNPPKHDKNDSLVEHNIDPRIDMASLNMRKKARTKPDLRELLEGVKNEIAPELDFDYVIRISKSEPLAMNYMFGTLGMKNNSVYVFNPGFLDDRLPEFFIRGVIAHELMHDIERRTGERTTEVEEDPWAEPKKDPWEFHMKVQKACDLYNPALIFGIEDPLMKEVFGYNMSWLEKETSLSMRKKSFEGQPENYRGPSLLLREDMGPDYPGGPAQAEIEGTAEDVRWNKENLLKKKKPIQEQVFHDFNIPFGHEGEEVRQL
ncbi:MAG: hypothetical protein KAW92_10380, partial [Candidatus Cloacimonetes bacterium]|nr:hypothetical protein [Candidatus Cloacimonadota bacterium]